MFTSRRRFLQTAAAASATMLQPVWSASGPLLNASVQQAPPGERPAQDTALKLLFPRARIPATFIIDDSTCLVNMGHFGIPQFHACYPDRPVYQKPWQTFPREIPDSFVREFAEWCGEHGVKGKYSIVPYPACVGWLDTELPGWSRKALLDSLELVRTLIVPNWDIHPEMITHTRVIDLATGRPLPDINPSTMENSWPQQQKSVDEIAAYLAYALRILKNCGLPCEGITTPGGFGNRVKPELSLAVQQAVRDVFQTEIPHFFKYVVGNEGSTEPSVEHVSGLGTSDVRLTVNIPAGTGDWFGGWEGDVVPQPDLYATADATSGRLVQLIEAGQPAFFLCHWPGLYSNGTKAGFLAFQQVVNAIHGRFRSQLHWMKLSEIARSQAARVLTAVRRDDTGFVLNAPFACPEFTVELPASGQPGQIPVVVATGQNTLLTEAPGREALREGTWCRSGEGYLVCFRLQKGETRVTWKTG
ncbi:MAG: hypothetical protein ACKO2P_01470 [Planctomycetota bacterium]